jgi:uncharacterized protein with NRDE domain
MCLLVFAWNAARAHRLVLAGNRDEFHARPTSAMDWWPTPRILAGRDLQSGGTWLAADDSGRFAVVTNYRSPLAPTPGAPSRGELIPAFFAQNASPLDWLHRLRTHGERYAGFSLLLGTGDEIAYWSNRSDDPPRALEPGVYGLSNGLLDTPWPKLVRTRDRFRSLLTGAPTLDSLLDLMCDPTVAEDHELPDTGLGLERERFLSSPFIVGPAYGTRCSTALTIDDSRRMQAAERSYAPDGSAVGTRRFELGERGAA